MSINTQKLLDEIERRYAALDSTSSLSELQRVSELNTRKDAPILTGAIQYGSLNQANAPSGIGDSAKVGEIFFVADRQLDSNGRFYFRSQAGFINMKTSLDSDENVLIDSDAAAAAAGSAAPFTGQAFFEGYNIQGDTYGYRYGGSAPPGNTRYTNTDRFSLASDGNAAAVPALTGGNLNETNFTAYTSHQYLGIIANGSTSGTHFPFANEDAWTAGNITTVSPSATSHAQASATHVYKLGGHTPTNTNAITKYPVATIASGSTETDVGDLTLTMGYSSGGEGASSETHCYRVGGLKIPGYSAGVIQKVAYASDGNATSPGSPTLGGFYLRQNCSSPSHGYAFGSSPNGGTIVNSIEKWSFTVDGDASDIADLTQAVLAHAGCTSTTHGYRTGGSTSPTPSPAAVNVIDKFPFASDGNATDVGDLSLTWMYGGGANE